MESYRYRIVNFLVNYFIDLIILITLNIYARTRRKKLIIISDPYGNWGNRLILFSYAICWAKKHNSMVLNPSFKTYSKYFPHFQENFLCAIPLIIKVNKSIINFFNNLFSHSFARITKRNDFIFTNNINNLCLYKKDKNTESHFFNNTLKSKCVVFLSGFLFGNRDFNHIKKNRNALIHYFKFQEFISSEGDLILSKFQNKNNLVIGLCIRQGDYKTHEGGKYYLNDSQYLTIIKILRKQFENNINFFIASEESKPNFPMLDNVIVSCGNPALNIYMLSKCDFLIGPPSTFLTWSSFYKSVPVSYIDNSNWKQHNYSFSSASF